MQQQRLSYFLLTLLFGLLSLGATDLYAQNGGSLSMPEWMQVDNDAKTVALEVVAGKTDAYNNWNFNGFANGEAAIVVPAGYTVTLTFKNNDTIMAHSLGIGAKPEDFPAMFDTVTPAFEGAVTSNPTDMMAATLTGKSEVITFTADKAGDYAIICYIPGHALTGMWIGFQVSAEGESGLLTH